MPLKENDHVVKKSSIFFLCVCVCVCVCGGGGGGGGLLNSCITAHLSSCEGLRFPGKEVAVSMCADVPLGVQMASVVCRRTYKPLHTSPGPGALQVRLTQTRTR